MTRPLALRGWLLCLTVAISLSSHLAAYAQTAPATPAEPGVAAEVGTTETAELAETEAVLSLEDTIAGRVVASQVQPDILPPGVPGPGPMGPDPLPLGARMHAVNLNAEGAITGRASLIDSRTGQRIPTMDVLVNFVQYGRIVTQARPGQNGEFTVRLRPGVYSVIVSGPGGFGAFSVLVQPFDPAAPPGASQLLLDGTLVPPGDLEIVAGLANRNLGIFAPPFGPGAGGGFGGGGGFSGGGGSGGGGGLGSLLGLAGIGLGAAALLQDDDDPVVVSPPVSPVQ